MNSRSTRTGAIRNCFDNCTVLGLRLKDCHVLKIYMVK